MAEYDITSIKDINNIKLPPIDLKIEAESPLDLGEGVFEDDGKYAIDRGEGLGKNKYGLKYRNNNYIETENKYDNLRQLDLNFADDDIGAYTGNFKEIGYDSANTATVDRYGNPYNTDSVSNYLGRFDEILKRRGKKSRFAEDAASTDDEYGTRDANNEEMAFMRAYEQQEFEPNFQIGRARRKRTLAEVTEDKQRSRNMLQAILRDNDNFPRGNPQVENLIAAVENRVRYTPRTEENYDWSVWRTLFRILAGGDIIWCIIRNMRYIIR
jgi:hypothetical protein